MTGADAAGAGCAYDNGGRFDLRELPGLGQAHAVELLDPTEAFTIGILEMVNSIGVDNVIKHSYSAAESQGQEQDV